MDRALHLELKLTNSKSVRGAKPTRILFYSFSKVLVSVILFQDNPISFTLCKPSTVHQSYWKETF